MSFCLRRHLINLGRKRTAGEVYQPSPELVARSALLRTILEAVLVADERLTC